MFTLVFAPDSAYIQPSSVSPALYSVKCIAYVLHVLHI